MHSIVCFVQASRRIGKCDTQKGKLVVTRISDTNSTIHFEISHNSSYRIADLDETEFFDSECSVRLNYSLNNDANESFYIETSGEFQLLKETFEECRDVCDMALRLNAIVRDTYYAGVYKSIDRNEVISVSDELQLLRERVEQGSRSFNIFQVAGENLGPSNAAKRAVNDAKRNALQHQQDLAKTLSCVYCEFTRAKAPTKEYAVHPYAPLNFQKETIFMCLDCLENWRTFRANAKRERLLVLDGERNEELCAICSDSPAELTMCSSCPRSFCKPCLLRVLTTKQLERLEKDEDWNCMCCKCGMLHENPSLNKDSWRTIDFNNPSDIALFVSKSYPFDLKALAVRDRGKSSKKNISSSSLAAAAMKTVKNPKLLKSSSSSSSVNKQRLLGSGPGVGPGPSSAEKIIPLASQQLSNNSNNKHRKSTEIATAAAAVVRGSICGGGSANDKASTGTAGSQHKKRTAEEGGYSKVYATNSNSRRRAGQQQSGEEGDSEQYSEQDQDIVSSNNNSLHDSSTTHKHKRAKNDKLGSTGTSSKQIRTQEEASDLPLPPVNKELDEIFYFSQYVQFYDGMCCEVAAGHNRFFTDDVCFLCKDGGDLVECDWHGYGNSRLKRCRKVYHTYCLAYAVEDQDQWRCPRHFCDICGTDKLKYMCKYCPVSICKDCPEELVKKYGLARYMEVESPATGEVIKDCVAIVCQNCLDTLDRCYARGEIKPEQRIKGGKLKRFPGTPGKEALSGGCGVFRKFTAYELSQMKAAGKRVLPHHAATTTGTAAANSSRRAAAAAAASGPLSGGSGNHKKGEDKTTKKRHNIDIDSRSGQHRKSSSSVKSSVKAEEQEEDGDGDDDATSIANGSGDVAPSSNKRRKRGGGDDDAIGSNHHSQLQHAKEEEKKNHDGHGTTTASSLKRAGRGGRIDAWTIEEFETLSAAHKRHGGQSFDSFHKFETDPEFHRMRERRSSVAILKKFVYIDVDAALDHARRTTNANGNDSSGASVDATGGVMIANTSTRSASNSQTTAAAAAGGGGSATSGSSKNDSKEKQEEVEEDGGPDTEINLEEEKKEKQEEVPHNNTDGDDGMLSPVLVPVLDAEEQGNDELSLVGNPPWLVEADGEEQRVVNNDSSNNRNGFALKLKRSKSSSSSVSTSSSSTTSTSVDIAKKGDARRSDLSCDSNHSSKKSNSKNTREEGSKGDDENDHIEEVGTDKKKEDEKGDAAAAADETITAETATITADHDIETTAQHARTMVKSFEEIKMREGRKEKREIHSNEEDEKNRGTGCISATPTTTGIIPDIVMTSVVRGRTEQQPQSQPHTTTADTEQEVKKKDRAEEDEESTTTTSSEDAVTTRSSSSLSTGSTISSSGSSTDSNDDTADTADTAGSTTHSSSSPAPLTISAGDETSSTASGLLSRSNNSSISSSSSSPVMLVAYSKHHNGTELKEGEEEEDEAEEEVISWHEIPLSKDDRGKILDDIFIILADAGTGTDSTNLSTAENMKDSNNVNTGTGTGITPPSLLLSNSRCHLSGVTAATATPLTGTTANNNSNSNSSNSSCKVRSPAGSPKAFNLPVNVFSSIPPPTFPPTAAASEQSSGVRDRRSPKERVDRVERVQLHPDCSNNNNNNNSHGYHQEQDLRDQQGQVQGKGRSSGAASTGTGTMTGYSTLASESTVRYLEQQAKMAMEQTVADNFGSTIKNGLSHANKAVVVTVAAAAAVCNHGQSPVNSKCPQS